MTRLLSIIVGLCLALPVSSQDTAFIGRRLDELTARLDAQVKPPEPPAGIVRVPWGTTDRTQWVIPRYADRKHPPAGGVVGFGPGSVLRATAATAALPAATRAVVITEDYGQPTRQFQGQAPTDKAGGAVLQPVIRDLTICGLDVSGDDFVVPGGRR